MKNIEDNGQFDCELLPLIYRNRSGSIWYKPPRSFDKREILINKPSGNQLLNAVALFHSSFSGGFHYKRNGVSGISIELLIKGTLQVRLENNAYLLEENDIFLMQPYKKSEMMTLCGQRCEKISILIDGILLDSILELGKLSNKAVLSNIDKQRFINIFQELFHASGNDNQNSISRRTVLCYELLEFLQHPQLGKKIPPDLAKLKQYLENNISLPLKLDDLAKYCNCSKAYLSRRFKITFGISLHQFLIQQRMQLAAQLLLNRDDLSIKEIAVMSGYQDQLNFSSQFRKFHHMSPRFYRRQEVNLISDTPASA